MNGFVLAKGVRQMTREQICEIAQKYGIEQITLRPTFNLHDGSPTGEFHQQIDWKFGQEDLIAFAQLIIEAERESSGVDKKLFAYKTLVESLEARIASHENNRLSYQEARDTLESERECNKRLTEELAERESSDEPVAWLGRCGCRGLCDEELYFDKQEAINEGHDFVEPLYRHPPPARKLTDEEIQFMWGANYRSELEDHYIQFARAIERRINGEKE